MNYYLMHKDNKVCSLDIDIFTGIIKDYKVLEKELFPVYIDNIIAMNDWWTNRAIPKTRANIINIIRRLNIFTPESLMVRNLALNLSDCYWVKEIGSALKYKEVNFYENDFEKLDLSSVYSNKYTKEHLEKSPTSSLNGQMPKYWVIRKGKRVLVKNAIDIIGRHQCLNEVFISSLHKRLKEYDTVSYSLITLNKEVKAVSCPCFTDINKEYIPLAYLIKREQITTNDINKLRNNIYKALEEIGISYHKAERFFSYLHTTDFIVSNTDRHLNNYGILRDTNTLKTIGFAPIFDNGNSLLYKSVYDVRSKEFKELKTKTNGIYDTDMKTIKHGGNWINNINLTLLPTVDELYKFYKSNLYEDNNIAEKIAYAYKYKIKIIEKMRENIPLYDIIKGREKYIEELHL